MNVELSLPSKSDLAKTDLPNVIQSYSENINEIYFGYNYTFRGIINIVSDDGRYNPRYASIIKGRHLDNIHHPLRITPPLIQFAKKRFGISNPVQEDFDLIEILNIHGGILSSSKTVNSETENQVKIVGIKKTQGSGDLVILMQRNDERPLVSLIRALNNQNPGGNAIIKFSQTLFTTFGAKLLYLFACLYKKIICMKPKTSSLRGTEFYVICIGAAPNLSEQLSALKKLEKEISKIISQRKFVSDIGTNLKQINNIYKNIMKKDHDFVKGIVAFNVTFEMMRYKEMMEFENLLRRFELSKKTKMLARGSEATRAIIEQWS